MADKQTTALDVATEWASLLRTHEELRRIANDVGRLRDDPNNGSPELVEEFETLLRMIRKMEVASKERTIELGKKLDRTPFFWNPEEPETE